MVDKLEADAKQYYDKLIELGGRPTRPINLHVPQKTTTADGISNYRDEDRQLGVTMEVLENDRDDSPEYTHWRQEMNKWDKELCRWHMFKATQRFHNEAGRPETDLELENTDAGLVEALAKLDDWQFFQSIHQNKVHEAERLLEQCQQKITNFHNSAVHASGPEIKRELQKPMNSRMLQMMSDHEQLVVAQKDLIWVRSQWTEVVAEVSRLIAEEPELQKQLEGKLEKQTNAIYHRLQQRGARPSHTVRPPNEDAEVPQRLHHWISESSEFSAELWNWRVFLGWRRRVKGADATDCEEQMQPTQVESSLELFEDHVGYCQSEFDKTSSWVDCWRSRPRPYKEPKTTFWFPQVSKESESDDDDDDDDYDDDDDFDGAIRAWSRAQQEIYAINAEKKVSDAAKRLERSKQERQSILAECGRPSAGAMPVEDAGAPLPPTPPDSQSPKSSPKNRRSTNKRDSAGKAHRRSKKEKVRKAATRASNTNTEHQALPPLSSSPNQLTEKDQFSEEDDTEMSDVSDSPMPADPAEESEGAGSEDTIMSDIEDPSNHTLPHPSQSSTKPSRNANPRKLPTTTRKTRSATKLDQALSTRVPKNTGKKPVKKAKTFTDQQVATLLNAASAGSPSTGTAPLRRSERLREKAGRKVCT